MSTPLNLQIHSPLLKPSSLIYGRSIKLFSSSSFALNTSKKSKYQQPIAAVLEVGGVKIAKDDVVRESDPTNNVPDSIFGKLGMQLHRRENHPLGILKDAIYGYFDANFEGKFVKFDDLCPIVTVQEGIISSCIQGRIAIRYLKDFNLLFKLLKDVFMKM